MSKFSRDKHKAWRKYKKFKMLFDIQEPFDKHFIKAWGTTRNTTETKRRRKVFIKELSMFL